MDVPGPPSICANRAHPVSADPDLPVEFEATYREHFSFAWRTVCRLGVPQTEAEDAVQEVFLVAYRRWSDYEGRASLRTWLYAIARKVASHNRRGRERAIRRHRAYRVALDTTLDGERQAHARHAAAQLQTFLDRMHPDKRSVFILCDLEGFTGREVASALGIKANTAWSRLKAARAEFARAFGNAETTRPRLVADPAPVAMQSRVWGCLVPQLSAAAVTKGAGAATLGAIQTWALGTNMKILAATLAIGIGGIGAAEIVVPEPPAAGQPKKNTVATAKTKDATPKLQRPKAQRPKPVPAAALPTVVPAPPPLQRPEAMHAASVRPQPQAADIVELPEPEQPQQEVPEMYKGPDGESLRLLHRARGALRAGKPYYAMTMVEEHERRFPKGTLTRLREITRVEALCKLGKKARAIGAADRLLRMKREERLVRRFQAACDLGPWNPWKHHEKKPDGEVLATRSSPDPFTVQ